MKHERLSLPLADHRIDFISSQDAYLSADSELDFDKHSLIPVPLDSDHPLRVSAVPTDDEANNPRIMITARLEEMSLYWHELANALLDPNKLRKNKSKDLSIIPIFYDEQLKFYLALTKYNYWKKDSETTQYPAYIQKINYGGDGDFFTKCQSGNFLVNMYDHNRAHYEVSADSLGITEAQRMAVWHNKMALDKAEKLFYQDTVNSMIRNALFTLETQWIAETHTQQPLSEDFDLSMRAIRRNIADDIADQGRELILAELKQNFLTQGQDGSVWQATNALADSIHELYLTAKS